MALASFDVGTLAIRLADMAAADASLELLAHFDAPAASTERLPQTRGIGWVLCWATALGVLTLAAGTLIELGYCLAAEQSLTRAAQAAALEATLPRASLQTIGATIERRLANAALHGHCRLRVLHNGMPVRGALRPAGGDTLSVVLSVPSEEVLPRWLRQLRLWRGSTTITVAAQRRMPGRELGPRP
jgi:hypothetical protein